MVNIMFPSYETIFLFILIGPVCLRLTAEASTDAGCASDPSRCKSSSKGNEETPSVLVFGPMRKPKKNIPQRRYKRSLNIPDPSSLTLTLEWSLPIQSKFGLTDLEVDVDITLDLNKINVFKGPTTTTTVAPTTKALTHYSSHASNRIETYAPAEFSRLDLYKHMENFLERKGYDGEECTLRTLCEFAEAPFEHGIYGDILNLIMSASLDPSDVGGFDKYMTAEYYGKQFGDCEKIYPKCEHSVLEVFSKKI